MSLQAPNIVTEYDGFNERRIVINRSPLGYNDRRLFGNRLKRLYNYLGTLKPSQYDHDSLVSELDTKAPCGSVACAFGHAVVSGQFRGVHAVAKLKRGAKPDEKGRVSDDYLKFEVVNKPGLKQLLKDKALKMVGDGNGSSASLDFSTAADAYFGPGAWKAIFDTDAYPWHGKGAATKAVVRKRIKDVAEKAYGVKVTA